MECGGLGSRDAKKTGSLNRFTQRGQAWGEGTQSLNREMGRLLSDCTGRGYSLQRALGVVYEVKSSGSTVILADKALFVHGQGKIEYRTPISLFFSHFNQCSQCIAAFLNGKVWYGLFFPFMGFALWRYLRLLLFLKEWSVTKRISIKKPGKWSKMWTKTKTQF